jgi:hypothetical protein
MRDLSRIVPMKGRNPILAAMAAEGMTPGSDLKQHGHEIRAIGKISWPMSAI